MPFSFDNPLGLFDPTGRTALTYDQLQQRKKIAAAMMSRRPGAMPRNLGEGIARIGETVGDELYYRSVDADEAAAKRYEGEQTSNPPEPTAPVIRPYNPPPSPTPQAVVTPPIVAPAATAGRGPLSPSEQQDPNSDIWRLPSAEAMDDWRRSVTVPQVVPPRPQPGPRSDVAPSPTGGANIPMLNPAQQTAMSLGGAGGPQGAPSAPLATAPSGTVSDAPTVDAQAVRGSLTGALAQAQPNVFPQVANDASKAVLPGGYTPPAPPAQNAIRAAPLPPNAVRAAPDNIPTSQRLPPPQLQPMINDNIRRYQAIASNPRLSDTARSMALEQIKGEQATIKDTNNQTLLEYNEARKQELEAKGKLQDPMTKLQVEEQRRKLEGEGFFPIPPEKAATLPQIPGVGYYQDRWGNLKTVHGPQSTTVTIGDKAAGKGDEKLQEKLSEHFVKTFEAGDTAGDEIKQLAEMRALAGKVGTGAGAVVKQYLGGWGIKSEGLSEIQALQAGISRLIPQQRVPGSGTSSDFDGQMFKDSVVGLSKTPQGNALIFDTMDGLAKNKLDRAEVAGRVVSGEITRSEGIKEMLALQRQARDLSERVKTHLETTGQKPAGEPAIPKVVTDDTMREFIKNNPTHPRANEIRKKLGM